MIWALGKISFHGCTCGACASSLGRCWVRWHKVRGFKTHKVIQNLDKTQSEGGTVHIFRFYPHCPCHSLLPSVRPPTAPLPPHFRLSSGLCPCWEASLHLSCTRSPCSGLPQHLCLPRSLCLPVVLEVFECLDLLPRQSHLGARTGSVHLCVSITSCTAWRVIGFSKYLLSE